MSITYFEEVTQRIGDTVIASNVRPATKKEIDFAAYLNSLRKCPHTIIEDEYGWPYDLRYCKICKKFLGYI